MGDKQDFQTQIIQVFQPVFMWGVAAFELALILYTLYSEIQTGTGLSLIYHILPLSIAIAVAWAVISVLITLVIVGIKNRVASPE